MSVASTPAFAKGHSHGNAAGNSSSSQPLVQQVRHAGHGLKIGSPVTQGNEHGSPVQTADLGFTVTGVPAIITEPGQLAGKLVFKVIPLPADATSAPATPPALSREQNKFDGKFKLGLGNSNPLTLNGTTLSGAIKIRGLKSGAGIQNLAVYPFLAADNRSGLAAQAGAPVFVIATTAVDGSVSLSGQSGDLTLDLTLNTGTIKTAQTATVNVPDDGKTYVVQVIRTSVLDEHGNQVADVRTPVVATIALSGTGALTVNLPDLKPGTYCFNLVQVASQTTGVSVGADGSLTAPLTIG